MNIMTLMNRLLIFLAFSIFLLVVGIFCAGVQQEDRIPPGNVTDLQVVNSDYFGFEIQFTSPGDDLYFGTPFRYEIRYSENPAFAEAPERNFEFLGIPVADVPDVKSAGSRVSFFIKNLEPKTRYYAALRVYDKAGNFSNVSNVVEVITSDVPGTSGSVEGRIELGVDTSALAGDGEKLYILFPGLKSLEIKGNTYVLTNINPNIPKISGSRVVWDGEKFISIGGHIEGRLADQIVAVYRDGKVAILKNEGNLVPFGPNGFFGYGILGHKIVKFGDGFAIVGGVKYFDQNLDVAVNSKKYARVGLESIATFKVQGDRLIWDVIYTEGTTTPIAVVSPAVAVFPREQREILIFGGRRSEEFGSPTADLFSLRIGEKATWSGYQVFSGRLLSIVNSCEAEGTTKIIYLKEEKEGDREEELPLQDIENVKEVQLKQRYLYKGKVVLVEDELSITKYFIVGRFRRGEIEFSGMIGIFYDGQKDVLVGLKPTFRDQEFKFPYISSDCSAVFLGDKLFLLYGQDVYVFSFRRYEFKFINDKK